MTRAVLEHAQRAAADSVYKLEEFKSASAACAEQLSAKKQRAQRTVEVCNVDLQRYTMNALATTPQTEVSLNWETIKGLELTRACAAACAFGSEHDYLAEDHFAVALEGIIPRVPAWTHGTPLKAYALLDNNLYGPVFRVRIVPPEGTGIDKGKDIDS